MYYWTGYIEETRPTFLLVRQSLQIHVTPYNQR